jgi:photosystem II stability/assembly factor-like uncharacterized protein
MVLVVSLVGLPALAHANGRMPGANDVAFDNSDPQHLVARATFGVVQSFDRGTSWQWICEQAIDTSGVIADPPLGVVADGSLVLLPPSGGALVSRDRGCSWLSAPAPLVGHRGVDLTIDPGDAAHLLVLTSTIQGTDAQGFGVYANLAIETRDSAHSWSLLATLPEDFEAETLEVAPSDAQRIYVSGTASRNPRLGILLRSDDGGESWTQSSLELPAGTGSLLISAIDPNLADRLWLRVPARGDTIGILPARLYLSEDKGASFRMLANTRRGMFGFALSPDGTELAYGGPSDGLFVGPSDGSGAFEKVSDLGVRCLRWPAADALYVCGTEPKDAFTLGVSRDKGASFEALYRMLETCPQECAEETSFGALCPDAWSSTGPFIRASGAMCSVDWAVPAADAGAMDEQDAGPAELDAGLTEEDGGLTQSDAALLEDAGQARPGKDAGCACRLAGKEGALPGLDLSMLLGLLVGRRWLRKRSS